jgi:hypothetical protein
MGELFASLGELSVLSLFLSTRRSVNKTNLFFPNQKMSFPRILTLILLRFKFNRFILPSAKAYNQALLVF